MTNHLSERAAGGGAPAPAGEAAGSLGRRNDQLMVIGVVGYAALIVLLMFLRGIEITPDVMVVAFALGAVLLGRGRLFLRDWLPFVMLFLAYELMRGLADNFGFGVHLQDMIQAERLVAFGTIPSQVLQDALHPAVGTDPWAILATIVYMLHFALPLVTGFFLWVWRRPQYYDFVAALIFLSLWGFVTFVLIPTAPPWYAAQTGHLNTAAGNPAITYLKPGAFDQLATAMGFKADYIYTYAFYDVNPNSFAAWPSLHVGYPFLSFLVLRRAFGRIGYVGLAYTFLVAFSVMYTGDHWLIDCIGGAAYAYVSYYAIVHGPAVVRRSLDRVRDDSLVTARYGGLREWVLGLRSSVAWPLLLLGIGIALAGLSGVQTMEHAGQSDTFLYLVPWAALVAGACLGAYAVIRRPTPAAPDVGRSGRARGGGGGDAVAPGFRGRTAEPSSSDGGIDAAELEARTD